MQINVAIYARLSKDDGKEVSTSIENQIQSLTEYAKKNNWNVYKVYQDDGYSGTNFNRPAFQQLLSDIERHKINILLTKDLSRLGRNYLETGYYTENFFPNNNVRFIAVNDNFDTKEDNDFAPFKNIINEWYAKDISKKIKFSLNLRLKEPKVLGCGIPMYGYTLNDNKERIIDPVTAPVIQLIFDLYIKGIKKSEILKYLYDQEIVSPGYYNYIIYNHKSEKYSKQTDNTDKYKWCNDSIQRIIRNIEYTGDLINHKIEKKSFKNKHRNMVNKEDRYHFEDVFEPIVSKEVFNKANEIMDSQINSSISTKEKKFLGLCLCSNCSSILKYERRKEGSPFYFCRNKNCNNKHHINAKTLEEIVRIELTEFKHKIHDYKLDIINFIKSDYVEEKVEVNNNQSNIENITKEINSLNNKIEKLIESNLNDEIPFDVYQKLLKKYKTLSIQLDKQLQNIMRVLNKAPVELNYEKLFDTLFTGFSNLDNIDYNFLSEIIDNVKIIKDNNKQKIVITYKFNIRKIIEGFELCKHITQQYTQESQKKIAQ